MGEAEGVANGGVGRRSSRRGCTGKRSRSGATKEAEQDVEGRDNTSAKQQEEQEAMSGWDKLGEVGDVAAATWWT